MKTSLSKKMKFESSNRLHITNFNDPFSLERHYGQSLR